MSINPPQDHSEPGLLPVDSRTEPMRLSRSPHPYHRRSESLVKERIDQDVAAVAQDESESSTERGTEADDERGVVLRSLPAPPLRARKGLRGSKTPLDITPALSPLPTPPASHENRPFFSKADISGTIKVQVQDDQEVVRYQRQILRKRAEVVRRTTEILLLGSIGAITFKRPSSAVALHDCLPETYKALCTLLALYASIPMRKTLQAKSIDRSWNAAIRIGFHLPSRFDVGSFLYPVAIPFLASVSLAESQSTSIVANLVLGLASVPQDVIPFQPTSINSLHWALTLLPLVGTPRWSASRISANSTTPSTTGLVNVAIEELLLLFPLHQVLLVTLKYLTTTSLEPAELHLLSVGFINVLLFTRSPQMQILKALMWLGSLCLFVFCWKPLSWEVSLARIPAWKLARNRAPKHGLVNRIEKRLSALLPQHRYQRAAPQSSDDEDDIARVTPASMSRSGFSTSDIEGPIRRHANLQAGEPFRNELVRSVTLPTRPVFKWTSLRKRRSPVSARSGFLSLTLNQAQALKWLIAAYNYVAVVLIVLIGLRSYIGLHALESQEPFGWAIGYLFGNISRFRYWVVSNNFERWIRLPEHVDQIDVEMSAGWIERARQYQAGPANTRLLLAGYCLAVLVLGIFIVFRIGVAAEVDTRRKVFHGIMVVMLLPTIPIDPCFISLALVLILAIFLLLDLFRASQLPPISRPLTNFLAPYVDGRDYRGPVIVSHIFLLIGCAIPLWLSLAGTQLTGQSPWNGWEAKTREVSMVSGVVCVGMGDAAASLIGRRVGRTKWFWGGGKSLEGSLAFAVAVTVGLMASYTWLRIGGWLEWRWSEASLALVKAIVAASGASILESVLTAANDNVVVPIGLWLFVRGLNL